MKTWFFVIDWLNDVSIENVEERRKKKIRVEYVKRHLN